jgi:dolichyl-phosphate-mannose-protein mannosyltransferase
MYSTDMNLWQANRNNQDQKLLQVNSLDRRDYVQLLLLASLAAAIRFYRLGDASFWGDEVLTLRYASLPWSTLWVTAYDSTPPLYYSIIRLITDISVSEWWLRLPSATFGTLTIIFVYLATRLISDSRAALASALLLTLSTSNIEYSQEGRAYALTGMCIALSFLGLAALNARWRESTSGLTLPNFLKSGGAVYGISVLAALYSHNTAVFFWMAAQFFFLALWTTPFKFSRKLLENWLAINCVILLLWLPWLIASLQVIDSTLFTWLKQYELKKTVWVLRSVAGIHVGNRLDTLTDLLVILLTLWGWISLRKNVSIAVGLLALLIFSSIVIWAYGLVGTPIFMRRTVLWGSMFSFMLLGIGISRLPLLASRAILGVLVCFSVAGFYKYDQQNRAENSDWRSPARIFDQYSGKGDILYFRTIWAAPAFLYYMDNDKADRRLLGWSCPQRKHLFGEILHRNAFSDVVWNQNSPDWVNSEITASTLWVIKHDCYDKESITKSDGWLEENWSRVNSWEFKTVTLQRWVPKQ